MSTGKNIQKFRKEKGFTQAQLADKSDISRVTLGSYERDERTPNINIANKIAEALDVSVDEIMGNSNELKYETLLNNYLKRYDDICKKLNIDRNIIFEKDQNNYNSHLTNVSLSKHLAKSDDDEKIKEDLNKLAHIKEITENIEFLDLESLKAINILAKKLKNNK